MTNRSRIVSGISAAGALAGFGYYCYLAPDRDLAEQIALVKKDGISLDAKDICATNKPTPAQNAAEDLRKADVLLKDVKFRMAYARVHGYTWGSGATYNEEFLPDEIKVAKPILDCLEKASKKPRLDYNREWTLGYNLMFPELGGVRRCMMLLVDKSLYESKQGKNLQALKTLQIGGRIASLSGQEPSLVALNVQATFEKMVQRGLEAILPTFDQNPKLIAEAENVIRACGPPLNMRGTLTGDLAFRRIWIDLVTRSPDHAAQVAGPQKKSYAWLRVRSVRIRAEARLIQMWREFYEDLPQDPSDVFGAIQAADRLKKKLKANNEDHIYDLASEFVGFLPDMINSIGTVEAGRRILRQGLATLEAEVGGKPPITLQDPFTGVKLEKSLFPYQYTIYSVGPDRHGDGGVPSPREHLAVATDVVFAFPRHR